MNNEEIVSIFVESVFLKIPYEEMKKRRLEEKIKENPQIPQNINEQNIEKQDIINKNEEKEIKEEKELLKPKKEKQKNTNKKSNKNRPFLNVKYTPLKTATNKENTNSKNKNENIQINTKTRTTKSMEKKKKIKYNTKLTENKQEIIRRINHNIFSEEKPRKIKKDENNSLKLTKDLMKKQQEEIDFNRKFDYLKKRIEALKVQEEKIRLEKNYIEKKEIKKGKNLANKKKQKMMLEEFKKKEEDKMKNRKESAKKIYEKENKLLKNFGSELSLKNREYFLQLKKEKEKLKKEKMKQDEEIMRQKKNKMILNKNKNINKEYIENSETQNNQKVNYIFTAKSIEYLKQNILNLEKLEKEYLKKIQDEKKSINEIPKRRNVSAKKSKNRIKIDLNKEEFNRKNDKKEEYSIDRKEDIINNNIDIDNIKLDEKINYNKYKDDSLKSDDSQENKILDKDEKKETNPELITLSKIIVENN